MTLFNGDLVTWKKLTSALKMCWFSYEIKSINTCICHLIAQLDSLKKNNKGKNNLPTNRREAITLISYSRALSVKKKKI